MVFVFILLLLALITLSIWNFLTFKKLKYRDGENEIKEPRYWELKYRMDYLIAVAAMGATVIAFFGYESLQSAKETVKAEIDQKLFSIKGDIDKTETHLESLGSFSDSINASMVTSGNNLDSQINRQQKILKDLERKIKLINDKNIVQQGFYVVRSLKLRSDHETKPGSNKIYLKDLITDKGERLPKFSNPPLIIPITQSTTQINIFNTTNESFEAYWGSESIDDVSEILEYSIVIIGEIKVFDKTYDKTFQ